MPNNRGQSSWISLSDLMTGLMLVFLLIVVMMLYLQYSTLVRYENTKQEIYDALNKELAREVEDKKVTISEDLVVRFVDSDTLFSQDSAILLRNYKDLLDVFIPKYINVLQDEKFAKHIREVRIEGHTGSPTRKHQFYVDLVRLSQDRSRAILKYFVGSLSFAQLDSTKKHELRFKLMANGFGNGRMIDADGRLICDPTGNKGCALTGHPNSRRVEFRIVTDAENQLAEALAILQKL